MEEDKIVCPKCGHTIPKTNFCSYCSQKLVKICDCWVLRKPFDCGKAICPGMGLLPDLMRKEVQHG